jgi:electron transfer flavoprotein alpha subunit
MAVLVVADNDNAHLRDTTHKTVTAALALSGDVDILVLGQGADAVAAAAGKIEGVRKVILAESADVGHGIAEAICDTIVGLAGGYDAVLVPATSAGKNFAPRVAAKLDASPISDVIEVVSSDTFVRPIYAGNAIITVEVAEGTRLVATVRTASFEAAGAAATAAPIEAAHPAAAIPTHTRFVSVSAARSDRPDLQTAAKVVSGGRALGSADNFQVLYSLADRMGAAVGASRAAVDAGYAANDMQVGQTGKIIAPELYMAFGISGAIQHLTGIKDARTIVAVNKDPEAPIFEVADFGLVGDLFQLVPEIEKLIASGS